MRKILIILSCIATYTANAQVPAYLPTDSLLCWYPFNGNANNTAPATLGIYNGTVQDAVLTADRFGNPNSAYHLDGDSANITIDTAFFDVGWDNYTISCWINSDTLTNYYNHNRAQTVINTIPHNGMAIYFNWGNVNKYEIFQGSNPPSFSWDILSHERSNEPSTPHVWKHVVLTKRNDTSYSLYLDGKLDTTYNYWYTAMSYYCKIVMGRSDPNVISEGFYGKIDDYAIWRKTLSICDIKRLYKTSPYLYVTSLPVNVSSTVGSTITFSITDTGVGNTYQWQKSSGSGFANITASPPYSGVASPTLTVTGITLPLSGTQYRCVVTGALCTDTTAPATLTIPTGIADLNTENDVIIFPNPASGSFSIRLRDEGNMLVSVTNALAGKILEMEVAPDGLILLPAGIPSGLYFVSARTAHGVYCGKLMVNK